MLEVVVMVLMSIIGGCFLVEMFIVRPNWGAVAWGFLPIDATKLMFDEHALLSALGIIGATVMPHNLYLHSSIVQHRLPLEEEEAVEQGRRSDPEEQSSLSTIINYATADSTVALFFAMFINAAILITAAAAFNSRGRTDVTKIEDASELMRAWLGPASSILFGLALLAAGQSSTVTGTMAGQIVFEGHLRMRMKPWLRRLITRVVAVLPALLIIWIAGEDSVDKLLIYSQVILSFQLPFAIIPLIIFAFNPTVTTDEKVKTYWSERSRGWEGVLKITSCLIAGLLIVLNVLFLFIATGK
jgi:manganese transport protein